MKARHEFLLHDKNGILLSKELTNQAYKKYLRIEFAKSAMQGMLAYTHRSTGDTLIKESIRLADDLIKELGI